MTETNLYKDQPAINLLVNMTNVSIQNLTLPPYNMQSTWAGDYTGEYERYWKNETEKPYLIHWAGCSMNDSKPINQLFTRFLSEEEKETWKKQAKKGGIAGQNLFSVGRLKQQLKHLFKS